MDIFSIFLISISLAIDAFSACVSTGTLLNKISIRIIVKFGCFFGLIQFFITLLGYTFGYHFKGFLNIYSSIIGFSLLFLLGFNMVYKSFKKNATDIKNTNTDKEILGVKNLLILSIATSIDALVAGISLAILNTDIILCSTIIGLTSFFLSSLGAYLGYKFQSILNFNKERFCGIILILLSLKILYL